MSNKPVVLFIFNRPDLTEIVFAKIRLAKPQKLLVIADGPRFGEESELCNKARAVIDRVDWECEVLKNYSDINMGCKLRVSSGLDWVFNTVEEAIIIEDDCVPNPDFFTFCDQLLEYYRNDNRIMMICGTNYLQNWVSIEESYFFSNYYPVWGWASWKRAWKLYDVDIKSWDQFRQSKQLFWIFDQEIAHYYENMFQLIINDFDTWDIQWWYTCIFQHGLAIVPRVNLISNIGLIGTHSNTQGDYCINMPTYPLDTTNLMHPKYVTPDITLNKLTYELSHASVKTSSELINRETLNCFIVRIIKQKFKQAILILFNRLKIDILIK